MHKIFTFFKNYAAELILALTTCVLLAVFQLVCHAFDSPWIHTIAAVIIPIVVLTVLVSCPLKLALYRNSDTYIWIGCSLVTLLGLLTVAYPSALITALIIAEVLLICFFGFFIMAFVTVGFYDPYA